MASARNLQRGVLGVPELQDAAGADVLDAVVLDAPLVEQRCGRVKVGPSVDREADVIEPDPGPRRRRPCRRDAVLAATPRADS